MTELVRIFGPLGINFSSIGPEVALLVTACVILLLDCFYKRSGGGHLLSIGLIGLGTAAWLAFRVDPNVPITAYYDTVGADGFSRLIKLILCGITAISFLMTAGYALRREVESAEYYALMLLATLGMMLMASGTDLILIFLGLEISSISQYIFPTSSRSDDRIRCRRRSSSWMRSMSPRQRPFSPWMMRLVSRRRLSPSPSIPT